MISAVINTLNAEKTIERALRSLKPWVDEIVVVDMHSADATVEICEKYGCRIFSFQKTGYVEPARNFAINKASCGCVFILDADEEVPRKLSERLKNLDAENGGFDFVRVPMITNFLGHWMRGRAFRPDYHIRFFRKGCVAWKESIHSFPDTFGKELVLEPDEDLAIRHFFCDHISDFVKRIDAYTDREADSLLKNNAALSWTGLIRSPVREFSKRFFKFGGYTDGIYGLIHSLLMGFYGFLSYAKACERKGLKSDSALLNQEVFFDRAVRELHKTFFHFIAAVSRVKGKDKKGGALKTLRIKTAYIFASLLRK